MKNIEEYKKKQQRIFGEFLHEIKTPLSTIRIHLETEIANEQIPLKTRQKLVIDVEEVARINHLLNDMVTLFMDESKLVQEKFENKSLLALLIDVVESLEPLAENKNQTISIISKQNYMILMDEFKLKQLFFNLISNAIKYSAISTKIEIIFSVDKEVVSVTVKDEGIGISQSEQDKIFDPFYRVEYSKEDGTGLGLAVCKAIASLHHASIVLKSSIKNGSSFTVRFSCPY